MFYLDVDKALGTSCSCLAFDHKCWNVIKPSYILLSEVFLTMAISDEG